MSTVKTYFCRIYKPYFGANAGSLIATVKDFTFDGFNWAINGGQGECVIEFARKISDFSEGVQIAAYNQFDIYVQDKESPKGGQLIYSGYLVEYSPVLRGTDEYVSVRLWGYATEFSQKMLDDGVTTQFIYDTQDPSDILSDAFTHFDGKITATDVPVLNETFSDASHLDSANTTAVWDY